MDKKIIELSSEDMELYLSRGFLEIKKESLVSKVSLDEILSLIVSAHNTVISKNIINALTNLNCNIIFCDKKYMPSSITIPASSHWQSGERIRSQINASVPLQKGIHKKIIQEKINNQYSVLKHFNPDSLKLNRIKFLSEDTKSGDTGNNEAIAAQIYFKELFGKDFIRDREANDINSLLNYGYIILRSCAARAVTGAGLIPALGIIHSNKLNPFTLVDDLMEPYRPIADMICLKALGRNREVKLDTEIKRKIAAITETRLCGEEGMKPLSTSILDTANSLAESYMKKKNLLVFDKFEIDLLI